ncbi:MAG: IS21-like element helper ATPase IstB [Pseudomonadota bacterium]
MSNHQQLKQQLKILKLSGLLENLDLRLLEAQQNQLTYAEFLVMMLADEIETRNMRKLRRLLKNAGLGNEKTMETFDFSFNSSINAAYIRELATCRFIEKAEGIFFIGPTGTGKTHLAKALCHQACRQHFSTAFYSFHQFFNELDKAELKNKLTPLIKKLITIDLLVIDDFGFKKITQQSAEYLYAIVDARYAVKSIMLTSNRAITDWATILPDPLMANAIFDRLAHHSHQIIIKGESYRKKFAPKFQNA